MALGKNRLSMFLLYIGLGFIIISSFKYLPFFSSVVFEDYINYDDRENKPYFIDNWNSAYPEHSRGFSGIWLPNGCNTYSDNTCVPNLRDDKWLFILKRSPPGSNLLVSSLFSQGDYVYILYPPSTQCGSPGGSYPCGGDARAIALENFLGRTVKTTIICGHSEGSCTIRLGNLDESKKYIIQPIVTEGVSQGDTLTLEVFASKLDPRIADIYIDGVFKKTVTFGNSWSIEYEAVKTSLTIKTLGYKIPFECQQGAEELLGLETFAGERTLSIYDLRYQPTKFCLAHPVIITDNIGKGSTATAEIYQRLAKGEVMTIPKDQTWTLFYIFYNSGDISQYCRDEYYDIGRGKCANVTGIVQFCSEGVQDPSSGTCYVTPEIKYNCTYGRYDTSLKACIWNPPEIGICKPPANYNSVTEKCEYFENGTLIIIEPEAKINCPPTYSFNPKSGYCEKGGDLIDVPQEKICPSDTVLVDGVCIKYQDRTIYKGQTFNFKNISIGLVAGIIITIISLFFIMSKPRR